MLNARLNETTSSSNYNHDDESHVVLVQVGWLSKPLQTFLLFSSALTLLLMICSAIAPSWKVHQSNRRRLVAFDVGDTVRFKGRKVGTFQHPDQMAKITKRECIGGQNYTYSLKFSATGKTRDNVPQSFLEKSDPDDLCCVICAGDEECQNVFERDCCQPDAHVCGGCMNRMMIDEIVKALETGMKPKEVVCKCPLCMNETISEKHFKKNFKQLIKEAKKQIKLKLKMDKLAREQQEAEIILTPSQREDLSWVCQNCSNRKYEYVMNLRGVYKCCGMQRPGELPDWHLSAE